MKLLALDTATEACSAALWIDGTVLERYQLAPRRHAALILPMLDAVLVEAGLTVAQLDAIAVGCGPGAFTGVRIAISIAQGIAFAADLPVVPISTLAALALGAAREFGHGNLATALDARMGEVYWGTYRAEDGTVALLGEEQCCPAAAVAVPSGDWFGVGSGWPVYAEALSQRCLVSAWQGDRYPRAADVARLAAGPGRRDAWVTAEHALPVYLRNQVAIRPAVRSG